MISETRKTGFMTVVRDALRANYYCCGNAVTKAPSISSNTTKRAMIRCFQHKYKK